MSFGEIDHFATMVAGCESINSGQPLTPDGKYAYAVLKLHATDMNAVAGQEGFLESIKNGANNVKEWIKKLINAILDFVFKGRKKVKEKDAEVDSQKPTLSAGTIQLQEKVAKIQSANKERSEKLSKAGLEYTSVIEKLLLETKECNEKAKEGFAEANLSNPPLMTRTIVELEQALKISRNGEILPTSTALSKAALASFDELDMLTTTLKKLVLQTDRIESPKILGDVSNKFTSLSDKISKLYYKLSDKMMQIHDNTRVV